MPEWLEPRGCHWGCTWPLVPSLPTPGGGGLEPNLGKPGKKNIKCTTFRNAKSEAQKVEYSMSGHMEYSWNIPGIFHAYSMNIPYFMEYSMNIPYLCQFPNNCKIPHLTPMEDRRAKWNIYGIFHMQDSGHGESGIFHEYSTLHHPSHGPPEGGEVGHTKGMWNIPRIFHLCI